MNSWIGRLVISLVLIFSGLYLYSRFGPGLPISSTVSQKQNLFSVTGTGKVTVIPDTAEISAGITISKPSVKDAQSEANDIINRVATELKKLGIPERDLKTTNYSVYPQYDYQSGTNRILGYNVSINLHITVRDLEKINSAIDIATRNGANQINGISLTINDDRRKELENQARELAIGEARQKAASLARLSGMTLGKIVDVQESGSIPPQPFYLKSADAALIGRGGDTQIQSGSTDITSSVTLFYETR